LKNNIVYSMCEANKRTYHTERIENITFTFWGQCCLYHNKTERIEKLKWVYLTTFSLVIEIRKINTANSAWYKHTKDF